MAAKYTVVSHKVKKLDENGNPIKNKKGNFIWETKENQYRVDPDFKPETIGDICADFIDNYVEANNEGEWLVELLSSKEIDKKGREKDISFVSLRSAFVKKFFPEIIKGTPVKEPTFNDRMRSKYGKK